MFKRRNPRSYGQIATEFVYPRGGWRRAGTYVLHRVRRLPDRPQRIGRGVAAGVFTAFTPFFGLHFVTAAVLAWAVGGNLLASLMASFVGNPVTFPLIAAVALAIGRPLLGLEGQLSPQAVVGEFSRATGQLGANIIALFTDRDAHWDQLARFMEQVFLPYLVGGILPGLVAGAVAHWLTVPLIRAHHKSRARKMEARIARAKEMAAAMAAPHPAPDAGAGPSGPGPGLGQ